MDGIASEQDLPSLQLYQKLRDDLSAIGLSKEQLDRLPTALVVHLIRLHQQVDNLRERMRQHEDRIRDQEFDITRLRGQRDALRLTLLRKDQQDPMKGYASEHMLASITEVIRREDQKKAGS